MIIFAAIGSVSAMLFLLLPSSLPIWPLAAVLAIAANVGFGASVVAMNAYLPGLAREDKDVVMALQEYQHAAAGFNASSDPIGEADVINGETLGASEPLLPSEHPISSAIPELSPYREKYSLLLSQATSRISSFGIALGYAAGIVLLLVTLVPVTLMKRSTFALRLATGCSGIWWAVFTVPAWIWLPDGGHNAAVRRFKHDWSMRREIWKAWKRLGRMLRPSEIKQLRNTFWYLAAWFLLSDGTYKQCLPDKLD